MFHSFLFTRGYKPKTPQTRENLEHTYPISHHLMAFHVSHTPLLFLFTVSLNYPLVNVYITMENQSTISMTIFNSKLLVITRGYDVAFHKSVHVVPSLGGCNSCRLTSEKHGKNSDVHSKCRARLF